MVESPDRLPGVGRRAFRGLAGTLLLAGALAAPPAVAAEARPLATDPALEARVMQVAEELRCLVCQNETLAASQADLAVDLRRQIRERLQRGEPPAQIVDFMVARYGEFVRYRPALSATTLLLWFGPFLLLLLALAVLASQWRGRRHGPAATTPQPLTDAELQQVRRLLADAAPPR